MIDYWKATLEELENGRPVFTAFVARCTKGSPGTPKARLLYRQDGTQFGTVGGGIMEKRLVESAAKAIQLANFVPRLQTVSHRENSVNPSGLICGGLQTNVLATFQPQRDRDTVRSIIEAIRLQKPCSIQISRCGLEYIESHAETTGLVEDASDWTYILNTVAQRRIAIFGAGHCGLALAKQMRRLDYHVTLCDERADLPLPARLRSITTKLGVPPTQSCQEIGAWSLTLAVVMTHSFSTDLAALLALLPYHPKFVGLMGSGPKLQRIFRDLKVNGISEKQIAKISAPIGLPIGSDTPEEIAVSIAAQILQERNSTPVHEPDFADYVSS